MEEQGHTCMEKTLLIKLMSRMSVDSHPHTHTHTHWLCHPSIRSYHNVVLQSQNWLLSLFIHEVTLIPQWTPLFGMEAVALFTFPATEADELSFQEGDIIKVSDAFFFFLDCWNLTKCCMIARLYICVYRWQKWRTILAGSQQKSKGNVATYHRTTFPFSLIRKTFY